jgi:hypothetical protein
MDDYAWWRAALTGAHGPIHDGQPQCGRYRVRWVSGGPWLPVAIWRDGDDQIVAMVDHDLKDANKIWTRVARNPVSDEEYVHRIERGTWPGDAPAPTPAPIGDNNPPEDEKETSLAALSLKIEMELSAIEDWALAPREGKIAGDKAANWLAAVRKIEKRLEDVHAHEKKPHLEACRAVDERWRRPREMAARAKQLLATIVTRIATAERERLRKAAEVASPIEEMITQAIRPSFGGAAGNKISLKQTRIAEIHDWAAAATHYSNNEKVRELIQKLANADARNGNAVPGTEIKIVERV